jgi:hypothetical protein
MMIRRRRNSPSCQAQSLDSISVDRKNDHFGWGRQPTLLSNRRRFPASQIDRPHHEDAGQVGWARISMHDLSPACLTYFR